MTDLPKPWLTAEARLLGALALARPSAAALAEADRLLAGPIDWDRFARLSLRHCIAPMMQHHLADDPRVPEAVRRGFSLSSRANAVTMLSMTGELLALSKAFAAADIPMISVKGPALAQQVDGRLGLRTIGDLDILIPPARAPEAIALITARGFEHIRDFAQNAVDDGLRRRRDGIYIELHRRLGMPWLPFHLPLADMFARVEPAPISGGTIPCLPLEENLLYLCYHGAKHGWSRMAWLTGFVGLLQLKSDQIDAAQLAQRTEALKLTVAMGSAMRIARDLLLMRDLPPPLLAMANSEDVVRFTQGCLLDGFAEQPGADQAVPADVLLAGFARRQSRGATVFADGGPAGNDQETIAALPVGMNQDMALRLPQTSKNLRARAVYAALGGSSLHYVTRALFAPSSSHVARYGVSAHNRLFYGIVLPFEMAGKSVVMLAAKIKQRVIGRKA